MDKTIQWLLDSYPWVEYRTRLDLLEEPENSPGVQQSRQAMLAHPQIKSLITELAEWPGHTLKRHNDAAHHLHKLTFLTDLGLTVNDPGMREITNRILGHQSEEGAFQTITSTYRSKEEGSEDKWLWMLCDAPLVLYSLVKMGIKDNPRIQKATDHLTGYSRENGMPCAISPDMGRFRGPGKKDDPCPYATLVSLRALHEIPELCDSEICRNATESLLTLWEQRKERRPYLFAMGTDFRKLKAPLIWYDILHVLDVLTQFPWTLKDRRLLEMTDIIREKADKEGRYTPESIWKAWSDWGFGQKKEPSPWVTLLARRILKRIDAA